MKQRFYFLDNLKGFCIIAVVMSHVNSFLLHLSDSFINQAFDTFFLSGFFLVSGYLGANSFSEKISWKIFIQYKTYSLLIPFFCVGTVFAIISDLSYTGIITRNPVLLLINDNNQIGYWFLLTLFVLRLISLLTGNILKNIGIYRCNKYIQICVSIVICFIIVAVWICLIKKISITTEEWKICQVSNILYYIPFYIFGYVLKVASFDKKLSSDSLQFVLFTAGIILCYCYWAMGLGHPLLLKTAYKLMIVVPIFLYFEKHLNYDSKLLTTCGTKSLEIYVLHFFFFIGCGTYSMGWFDEITETPFIIQLFICTIGAVIIISPTLLIAKILKRNSITKFLLTGKY